MLSQRAKDRTKTRAVYAVDVLAEETKAICGEGELKGAMCQEETETKDSKTDPVTEQQLFC